VEKGVAALFEANATFLHLIGKPMVLVEADPGRKWEIGTDPNEHASEVPVVQIEVKLVDPPVLELEMAPTRFFGFDAVEDSSRLSRLYDRNDLIRLSASEEGFGEFVTPVLRCFKKRSFPDRQTIRYPVLVLACDITQHIPRDRIDVAAGAEETNNAFGLLERLDGGIEKHPIEAAIMESDVILMVLKEGVHGNPPRWLAAV
jgi:hypothetical protein